MLCRLPFTILFVPGHRQYSTAQMYNYRELHDMFFVWRLNPPSSSCLSICAHWSVCNANHILCAEHHTQSLLFRCNVFLFVLIFEDMLRL